MINNGLAKYKMKRDIGNTLGKAHPNYVQKNEAPPPDCSPKHSPNSLVDVAKWTVDCRHNVFHQDGPSIIAQVHRSKEGAVGRRRNYLRVLEMA